MVLVCSELAVASSAELGAKPVGSAVQQRRAKTDRNKTHLSGRRAGGGAVWLRLISGYCTREQVSVDHWSQREWY